MQKISEKRGICRIFRRLTGSAKYRRLQRRRIRGRIRGLIVGLSRKKPPAQFNERGNHRGRLRHLLFWRRRRQHRKYGIEPRHE